MILVTRATGNVGSELISHLTAAKQPVRALVRGDGPARLPADVEIGQGNLDEPHTLRGALKDVSRVFFLGGYRDTPALMAELAMRMWKM
jgi:uncharacterized protein YbjT (DUF2867 family)